MQHIVKLDDSFVANIDQLDAKSRSEVNAIWKELDEDRNFRPDPEFYVTEGDPDSSEDGFVVCQHVNGWGGWALSWFPEYGLESTVEAIILALRRHDFPPAEPSVIFFNYEI